MAQRTRRDDAAFGVVRPSVQPFLRSVIRVDPAAEARLARAPLLILSGGRDAQVAAADRIALGRAVPAARVWHRAAMGHTLKDVADDDPRQVRAYTDPSAPLSPGLADAIARFVTD